MRSHSQANRGMGLERLIDMANTQYRNKGVADIRKIPTPVKITSNIKGKVSGHVTKGELVDYFGVKDGRAIVFDAKETNITTSFTLKNVHEHQFQILKSWHQKGAKAFLLIFFYQKTTRNLSVAIRDARTSMEGLHRGWKKIHSVRRFRVSVRFG